MPLADVIAYSLVVGGVVALIVIIRNYLRGLHGSPRDMWLLFGYNVIEYTAYAAMNMALVLWLSADCKLGDVAAGSYIAAWSIMLSIMAMVAGALVDTIGIRRTQLLSILFLLISRFFMAFVTNPILIFILGFVPLAIGFAIVGPLISVAIKRFTTKEGAALGFALFYVIMNIAYAIGGWFFDWIRDFYAQKDAAGKIINENFGAVFLGAHLSTYQLIFVFGFGFTCVSLLIAMLIREGVKMTDQGVVVEPPKSHGSGLAAIKNASKETGRMIASVTREKYFWIFIGMLATTVFVRFIFFHFHYTFPKYGIRVLGEGAKIGSIYGVLNPVLIVFLVPLVASLTKKVSSYRLMIVGSIVSSLSCFLAVIPASALAPLTHTVLGELIFIKWLGLADSMQALVVNPPVPEYWPLILFITIFTIGESIWSPRLMQFTAEIAPEGKEGTYIALSILPWFAAKFVVGPMSGLLVSAYTPVDEAGKAMASYPEHYMVWVWIGGMALLTPVGLLIFRNLFRHKPNAAAEAA
ncbi:MAG: MFS transporter [Myxococcales bacterium]|nr:MAG: MFS transporter [Myxococcales bacterium]